MQQPTNDHFSVVKHILRYVQGTLNFGLNFRRGSSSSLIGYSDADWARCIETRRSTYGYSIFLGNNLISWSGRKQPTVSRSSCESEYRAMANTSAELVWVINILRELRTLPSERPILLCDNKSAIFTQFILLNFKLQIYSLRATSFRVLPMQALRWTSSHVSLEGGEV